MTTPEHQKIETTHSISSDIIEDTDEEIPFDIKKRSVSIRSCTESESDASMSSFNKISVDDQQKKLIKGQERDPTKLIKVLSNVIIKPSREPRISNQGTAIDNTAFSIKKVNLPLTQTSQQPIQEIILPSLEPHKDVTSSISFQQPAETLYTADYVTDDSMVHLYPENMEGKSQVTFSCNMQQSPDLLCTKGTDISSSNNHSPSYQTSTSLPTVITIRDAGLNKDETFCHPQEQSPNSLATPNILHNSDRVCCDDNLIHVITSPNTLQQQSASTSAWVAPLQENKNFSISESMTDIPAVKSLPKRRKRSKSKAFMDFLSDDNSDDFSSGSSELWSCNESALSSDEDQKICKKKKKYKKKNKENKTYNTEITKKEKPVNNRRVNKKLKDQGKIYENRKGELVSEKTMKINPCTEGKCARGCYNITEERRTALFQYFWNLDSQRRRDWIVHCARNTPVKRKKTKNDFSRRTTTFEYFINDGEGHRQVCQKFLINTLDITQKFIAYTLSNSKEEMAQEDLRKPNISSKFTEEAKTFAKTYIENLPAVPSHYNRKKSTKTYLPQEMKNILNLYRMYLKYCLEQNQQALSENAFRLIFKEYNISFHIPKKDKCVVCVKAENNEDEMNEQEKEQLKAHIKEKKATYERFKIHQTIKSINETVTCSFDLQKVLNTPHGQSMLLYYSRKYSVFNFTIYESGTQDVYCFTWGECDAKRGSNEIATCLIKYLEEKDRQGIKHLLMYCDSCCGQNKNKNVLAAVNYFLKTANNLEVVQLNCLLPGHTYMPVDTVHAVIEREVRKIIVWSPSQWPTYFESARKNPRPYKVIVLDHSEFLNFNQLATNVFTPMTSKNIRFRDIRVATFKKKYSDQIFVKYSMEEDAQSHTLILREMTTEKGKGRGKGKGKRRSIKNKEQTNKESLVDMDIVKQLYDCRIPISAAKYKDLINLCENGTIPKRFHGEYRELPCSSKIPETLNETDEEDEKNSDEDDN